VRGDRGENGRVSFRVPPGLADACFVRLGVDAPRDIAGAHRLLEAMAALVPTGSTAKNEAVDAGRVPPGHDPVLVADAWLARPGLAWSCWAVATLYAALVAAGGEVSSSVLGARRVDPATVPVDVHSVVELRHRGDRWVADPFFWLAPARAPVGELVRPTGWGHAVLRGDAWQTAVGSCASPHLLRYRTFTLPLTAEDVEGFCRISLTHTGVSARPRAHLATADGMVAATVDRDGAVRFRRWRADPTAAWGTSCETVELTGWEEAERRLVVLAPASPATAPDRRRPGQACAGR
jgi:hypothetical protein